MLEWLEQEIGYDIVLWFQSWRTDWVAWLFRPFDWVGTELFFISFITLIYWVLNKRRGRSIAVFFLFTVWLNSFCKGWWGRPRPYQVSIPGKPQVTAAFGGHHSFGIPSGHTMSSAAFFSMTALQFRKNWLTILSAAMILLVPFSRLVHGMHFPQDIIAGYLLTFAVLIPWIFLEGKVNRFASRKGAFFLVPLIIIQLTLMTILPLITGTPAEHLENTLTLGAMISAGLAGFAIESRYIRFDVAGSLWKKALRYAVGLAVLVGLKTGLKIAFSPLDSGNITFIFLSFEMVQGAVLGLWITAGAPALFIASGLAEREALRVRKN